MDMKCKICNGTGKVKFPYVLYGHGHKPFKPSDADAQILCRLNRYWRKICARRIEANEDLWRGMGKVPTENTRTTFKYLDEQAFCLEIVDLFAFINYCGYKIVKKEHPDGQPGRTKL